MSEEPLVRELAERLEADAEAARRQAEEQAARPMTRLRSLRDQLRNENLPEGRIGLVALARLISDFMRAVRDAGGGDRYERLKVECGDDRSWKIAFAIYDRSEREDFEAAADLMEQCEAHATAEAPFSVKRKTWSWMVPMIRGGYAGEGIPGALFAELTAAASETEGTAAAPPAAAQGSPAALHALAHHERRQVEATQPHLLTDARRKPRAAMSIWNRDPVWAFEYLRDRVCEALDFVCEIHQKALAAGEETTLANVGREWHAGLHRAIVEAQAIWIDTPARRYLDRSEPIFLDCEGRAVPGCPSGSSYHDLALAVAVGLWKWIETRQLARSFVRHLRYHTAAGDHVGQHLCTIKSHVSCECRQAIDRFSKDQTERCMAEQRSSRMSGSVPVPVPAEGDSKPSPGPNAEGAPTPSAGSVLAPRLPDYSGDFADLLRRAQGAFAEEERSGLVNQAFELARQEHHDAEPLPAYPDPVADLRRDCVFHLRFLDILEVCPNFAPHSRISQPVRHFWRRMRDLYQSQRANKQPPLEPGMIPTGSLGSDRPVLAPAREAVRSVLAWCQSVNAAQPSSAPDPPVEPAKDAGGRERPGEDKLAMTKSARTQVFFSYSHKDKKWLERFQTTLKPAVPAEMLWDDTKIKAGAKWKDEIQRALAAAKVAVLLVSPDFLASEFIAKHELPPLLSAAKNEGLTILWVPVRDSMYGETEITEYQAAHEPSQPLASLTRAKWERAIVVICKRIKEASQPPSIPPSGS